MTPKKRKKNHAFRPKPVASPASPKAGRPSLSVARHRQAWEKVVVARKNNQPNLTDLKNAIQGIPVALRTQGLPVTIARLIQRDPEAERWLANRIAEWLLHDCPSKPLGGDREIDSAYSAAAQLLQALMEIKDSIISNVASSEAIHFSNALKLIITALAADPSPALAASKESGEDDG